MQWRDSILGASTVALVAALLTAAPADAGTLYRWVTESGTLAFADDPKRIPERYRESAEEIHTEGSLDDHPRFTPIDSEAQAKHADRLAERLERLRGDSSDVEDESGEPGAVGDGRASVTGIALGETDTTRRRLKGNNPDGSRRYRFQTTEQTLPTIELGPGSEDEGPVVVEQIQIRDRDGFTRRARVVRQGDRILSIVKGPKHHFNPRDFVREEDLER